MIHLALWLLAATQDAPRIETIELASEQPHVSSPHVIWYDSFDDHDPKRWKYMEPGPDKHGLTDREALGGRGRSMKMHYARGHKGTGNRKIVFGDSPIGRPLRRGEKFDTIYWRIYVKHPAGWTGGGPAKMSRAIVFASPRWQQASILHVWSAGEALTLDPTTGVRDGEVVTRRYNDFQRLRWLGNSPRGAFAIHGAEGAGRWVCVEARMTLNTPGKKDGTAALWVDGRLDAERKGMDFRGSYTGHSINAVFLEAYWNKGSPVDQSRWYDDFVVSTRPIGPLTAGSEPALLRTAAPAGPWEAEVASDPEGKKIVWKSGPLGATARRVIVSKSVGTLIETLRPGTDYFCRTRLADGSWSPWHQPFRVASPN